MRIGYVFAVVLLFALAMTSVAGPALDKARNERPASGEGITANVKDNDFVFAYSSRGGANVAKDMQMWETGLTVDSGSGLATLETNRDYDDDAGRHREPYDGPAARSR